MIKDTCDQCSCVTDDPDTCSICGGTFCEDCMHCNIASKPAICLDCWNLQEKAQLAAGHILDHYFLSGRAFRQEIETEAAKIALTNIITRYMKGE